MDKRLHRSSTDRKVAGVCGGIAQYLGWDPTLVRLLWILLTLAGGSGILIYLILWVVMPDTP
jgi:phage shock protein PspC (stress-responsive transcriptional regulator)